MITDLDFINNDFNDNDDETNYIDIDDFVNKTKKVLLEIEKEYRLSYSNIELDDNILNNIDEKQCEQCQGEGTFIMDDNQMSCYKDIKNSYCYIRHFNNDRFVDKMEGVIYDTNSPFYELIYSEIIKK